MKYPVLDPVREKLYFFNYERELQMLDLDTGLIESLGFIECLEINGAVLIAGLQFLIAIQADQQDLLLYNLQTLKTQKQSSLQMSQMYSSSIMNTIVMRTDRTLDVLNLDIQNPEIERVMFHSSILKNSRPLQLAPNNSGIYYAAAFENGVICLFKSTPQGFKEECIIAQGDDFLQSGARIKKLSFSLTGDFLYVLDTFQNLHKFLIKQNLAYMNEIYCLNLSGEQFSQKRLGSLRQTDQFFTTNDDQAFKKPLVGSRKLDNEFPGWLTGDQYETNGASHYPIEVVNISISGKLLSLDSDGYLRVWNPQSQRLEFQISKHLSQFKNAVPVTLFYWETVKCFIGVYETVIILVDPEKLSVIGHIVLGNEIKIDSCSASGNFLFVVTQRDRKIAIEIIPQKINIKASRTYPCTFHLYFPNEAKLVMYPGTVQGSIPFYPGIFKRHAFEKDINLYSPVLFWYKLKNYGGLNAKNLKYFVGHQHVIFLQLGWNLLHLYALASQHGMLQDALKRGAPMLPDIYHDSPLSISILRKQINCTNVILQHFINPKQNQFYNDALILQECQTELPEQHSRLIPQVYKSLHYLPKEQFKLPNFVHLGGKDEVIIPLKNENPKEALEANVDLSQENEIATYLISKWELDMVFGSKNSIEVVDGLIASKHLTVFEAPIVQAYIRYHWRTARKFFCVEAFLFLIYLFSLSIHAVVLRNSTASVIVVLILSLVQLGQELWQGIGQGCKEYFSDKWNIIDYFSLLSVWAYCIFYLADIYIDVRLWLLTFSLFQLWLKCFSYTRLFASNRLFIRNFSDLFRDIMPFLGFMALYTLGLSVIYFGAQEDPDYSDHTAFTNKLFQMYRFSIKKYNLPNNAPTLQEVIFIPTTIAFNIVLWTEMVVMIMGILKGSKSAKIPNDYKEIASIISDYQLISMWNREKHCMRYLFVVLDSSKATGINGMYLTKPQQVKAAVSAKTSEFQKLEAPFAKLLKRVENVDRTISVESQRFRIQRRYRRAS